MGGMVVLFDVCVAFFPPASITRFFLILLLCCVTEHNTKMEQMLPQSNFPDIIQQRTKSNLKFIKFYNFFLLLLLFSLRLTALHGEYSGSVVCFIKQYQSGIRNE